MLCVRDVPTVCVCGGNANFVLLTGKHVAVFAVPQGLTMSYHNLHNSLSICPVARLHIAY